MSDNLKIKWINTGSKIVPFADLSPQEIELIRNHPNIFSVEYEPQPPTPKNNVLYELVEPEYNQPYCYVDSNGEVAHSGWTNSRIDNLLFNINNVFLAEANAQKQADRLKLLAEIQRFADLNNDFIDWNDESQSKYYFNFNFSVSNFYIGFVHYCKQPNTTYFSSKNLINQVLEKFQDRLNILLD